MTAEGYEGKRMGGVEFAPRCANGNRWLEHFVGVLVRLLCIFHVLEFLVPPVCRALNLFLDPWQRAWSSSEPSPWRSLRWDR